jgi:predicted dehydrogenase
MQTARIVGSKGLAQLGGIAVNELQIFTPEPEACVANSVEFKGIAGFGAVYGYGHFDMYRDIVTHFRTGAPYPVSREDALRTLRLLHAFYRADEAGGWVRVDDPAESHRLGRPDDRLAAIYRTPEQAAAS